MNTRLCDAAQLLQNTLPIDSADILQRQLTTVQEEQAHLRHKLEAVERQSASAPASADVAPVDLAAWRAGEAARVAEAERLIKAEQERLAQAEDGRVAKLEAHLDEWKRRFKLDVTEARPTPCATERAVVTRCYEESAANSLVCADAVRAFRACTQKAAATDASA